MKREKMSIVGFRVLFWGMENEEERDKDWKCSVLN